MDDLVAVKMIFFIGIFNLIATVLSISVIIFYHTNVTMLLVGIGAHISAIILGIIAGIFS